MNVNDERTMVLKMVQDGKISAEQAAKLLAALGADDDAEPARPKVEVLDPPPNSRAGGGAFTPSFNHWKWTWVPITAAGGVLLLLVLPAIGGGLGSILALVCVQIPLMLVAGVLVALGLTMRTSPWLHVRVEKSDGEWPHTIKISLPLPLKPVAWFLRQFGHFIPQLKRYAVDDLIVALEENLKNGEPFFVEVDEGNGEKVQVHIG